MMQRGRHNTRPNPPEGDGPRPEDIDDFGDVTRPCPKCGATLYDDVELCYKCGHAMGGELQSKPPVWMIVIVVLIALGLLAPIVMRIF